MEQRMKKRPTDRRRRQGKGNIGIIILVLILIMVVGYFVYINYILKKVIILQILLILMLKHKIHQIWII